MFDKIKNINNLRKTQSEVKKELEQVFVQQESKGIKLLIRGDKRIEKLEIDGEDQKILRDLLNDTLKEVDKKVEKIMRGRLSDFGLDL